MASTTTATLTATLNLLFVTVTRGMLDKAEDCFHDTLQRSEFKFTWPSQLVSAIGICHLELVIPVGIRGQIFSLLM
jgi:hypothetical protein